MPPLNEQQRTDLDRQLDARADMVASMRDLRKTTTHLLTVTRRLQEPTCDISMRIYRDRSMTLTADWGDTAASHTSGPRLAAFYSELGREIKEIVARRSRELEEAAQTEYDSALLTFHGLASPPAETREPRGIRLRDDTPVPMDGHNA